MAWVPGSPQDPRDLLGVATGAASEGCAGPLGRAARWRLQAREPASELPRPPSLLPSDSVFAHQIKEIGWADVGGWTGQGGSILGTKR